jgi:2-polyprenyl-6-methoxyphenol hydroxylase-like FAD-dependent oxidoreductase
VFEAGVTLADVLHAHLRDDDVDDLYERAVALAQDSEGVTLTLRGDRSEEELRARFVVGCDGARSFVREALGLPFKSISAR